jgi:CheY-like chemotaxis protein
MKDDTMSTTPVIVYVEDNAGDVLLLQQAFEQRLIGITMQVIPTGDEALRYLRVKETARDAPPPDLLLFDLHLPSVNGDELVAHVQKSEYLRGIPWFIFADPCGGPGNRHPHVPPDRCLTKPSEWAPYLELVDRLVAEITAHRKKT